MDSEDYILGTMKESMIFGPSSNKWVWDKVPEILIEEPELALEESILSFHDKDYVELVKKAGKIGNGYLDTGDTPAFRGAFEASSYVVGSTLKAFDIVIRKTNGIKHAFNPIGGLHHSKRTTAAGFCIFNDIGIAILEARRKHGIKNIAYIDIHAAPWGWCIL